MNKPKPKKELVITRAIENAGADGETVMFITVITQDAKLWLEEHAPEFGDLLFGQNGRYHLHVHPMIYDPQEVVEYIKRMGI